MMVVFVIPLKSQAVSKNFGLVLENLDRTLRSVSNSSSKNYQALVVSNDPKLIKPVVEAHRNVEVLPFPSPRDESALNPGHKDMDDKRMVAGMHLREKANFPVWVMTLDADDLVDRDLVSYVNGVTSNTGLILTGGYILSTKSGTLTLTRAFHRKSGSRCVFQVNHQDMPLAADDWSSRYSVAIQEQTSSALRQIGYRVKNITWPAGLYVQGHAESISQDPRTKKDKENQIKFWSWDKRCARKISKYVWKKYLSSTDRVAAEHDKQKILIRFGVSGPDPLHPAAPRGRPPQRLEN